MAAVLEAVGAPALSAAEADERFEEEALAAWESYQLEGEAVTMDQLDALFDKASQRARSVAARRRP
jgi:predicted transcriptional regulator